MGSPANTLKTGHYKGNGSATKRVIDLSGLEPRVVRVQSVRGQAWWNERAPGAFKITDSAVPSLLGAAELAVETDIGFNVASTDATLNENAVDYYWEAY
jgi:hypothetical protein